VFVVEVVVVVIVVDVVVVDDDTEACADCAAATALAAFTRPQPKDESKPGAPMSSEFCSIKFTTWSALKFEFAESIRAATPAAMGEAKEVPYHVLYPPPLLSVRILFPGAEREIQLP
jgi:hypothetical protein